MTEILVHKTITVSGRVQGVGFRYAARHTAIDMGVTGFVRNLSDGNVFIEAEGDSINVDRFVQWCQEGPPRAIVKNLEIYEGEVRGYNDFSIR